MNSIRFDSLARGLSAASRRAALRALALGALGALINRDGESTGAQNGAIVGGRRRPDRRRRKRDHNNSENRHKRQRQRDRKRKDGGKRKNGQGGPRCTYGNDCVTAEECCGGDRGLADCRPFRGQDGGAVTCCGLAGGPCQSDSECCVGLVCDGETCGDDCPPGNVKCGDDCYEPDTVCCLPGSPAQTCYPGQECCEHGCCFPGGICPPGANACRTRDYKAICNDDFDCGCFTGSEGTTICGEFAPYCRGNEAQPTCRVDADCIPLTGPGSVCIESEFSVCSRCQSPKSCIPPCPSQPTARSGP